MNYINIQASVGEAWQRITRRGEQATGGERQEVASELPTMDGRLARHHRELQAKPLVMPIQRLRAVYLYNLNNVFTFYSRII